MVGSVTVVIRGPIVCLNGMRHSLTTICDGNRNLEHESS